MIEETFKEICNELGLKTKRNNLKDSLRIYKNDPNDYFVMTGEMVFFFDGNMDSMKSILIHNMERLK